MRQVLERELRTFDDAALAVKIKALQHFRGWLAQKDLSDTAWCAPSLSTIIEFLLDRAQAGKTTATSAYFAFQWWENHVGLPFKTTHKQVSSFRAHDTDAEPHQKEPVEPGVVLRLKAYALGLEVGLLRTLVLLVLLFAASGLRFKHAQRSRFVEVRQGCLVFQCRRGKRRQHGRRPGFTWAVHTGLTQDGSELAELESFLKQFPFADDAEDWYLVPAVVKGRAGVIGNSDQWQFAPMSQPSFESISATLLLQAGMSADAASRATTYTLRRFLPTIALRMLLSTEDRQAIGNWIDIPKAAGEADTRTPAIMSLRYADAKHLAAAHVKRFVFLTLERAAERPAADISDPAVLLQAAAQLRAQLSETPEPKSSATSLEPNSLVPEAGAELEATDSDDVVQSPVAAPAVALPIVSPEEAKCRWFVQLSSLHFTADLDEVPRPLPLCRIRPFMNQCLASGDLEDSFAEYGASLCTVCHARAPQSVRATLENMALSSK